MNWQSVLTRIGGTVLSTLGAAAGGPLVGAALGKAGEMLAEQLGVDPTPQAVATEAKADLTRVEQAARVIADDPSKVELLKAMVARAAQNDAVEAEKGFGAWQMRRTVTTYLLLAMLGASFFASLASALGLIRADAALLTVLVSHSVTLFMAWNGLVSGGRAVTDAVKAWKGGA